MKHDAETEIKYICIHKHRFEDKVENVPERWPRSETVQKAVFQASRIIP